MPSLNVAIVGSGPSGFYAAEHLRKRFPGVAVDMFDRLPTPFGLVRGGVAPDHQKIKSVTKVYDRVASQAGFRFFGNVNVGTDLTRAELRRFYHAVIYTFGAQSDRHLGIPGEGLPGSHAATEFVGWYNGHPDFRDLEFDLAQENVAVVGVGNVAIDVARILARTPEELVSTDIADHALEALRASRVRNIWLLGRRGPVQAAFTNPELKELGEMAAADIRVRPEELELDEHSAKALESGEDRTAEKNLQTLQSYAGLPRSGKPRCIHVRFKVSPLELQGSGRVERMVIGRNRLVAGRNGDVRAEATGETETLDVGLVFRSVGYFGVSLPDVPFDSKRGVIPNTRGRVEEAPGTVSRGEYVSGWIKRGPSGVIGSNKPDAVETVDALLEDQRAGALPEPSAPVSSLHQVLAERHVRFVTYDDWRRLDELERANGAAQGRPRLKFTRIDEMLAALALPASTARSESHPSLRPHRATR